MLHEDGNQGNFEISFSFGGCRCAYCLAGKDHNDNINPEMLQRDALVLPGGGGTVTPPSIGLNNAQELIHGFEWGPGGGTPVSVTYSFLTSVPFYYAPGDQERNSFSPFTPEMQNAVRDILDHLSTFANVTFTEIAGVGDITFGQAALAPASTGLLAWGYYPDQGGFSGDVWFNNNFDLSSQMSKGEQGYYTAMHEIGHALGLLHTFEAGLSGAENTEQFSVMAYNTSPWGNVFAQSYMLYDIAALQTIYGANTAFNSGDTTYVLDPGAALTVWDGGGSDTFDASAVSSSVTIHLEEGGYSSVGLIENIAIAYGTVIENAVSGAGNDILYGNDADNILRGGLGNDAYHFASGDDTITDLGGLADILYLPETVAVSHVSFLRYAVAPFDLVVHVDDGDGDPLTSLGTITVENQFLAVTDNRIETIRFFPNFDADLTNQRITTFGGSGDDVIEGVGFGAHPDDTILGFDGNDEIDGGAGNDTLYGDAGDDYLMGGAGGDALFGKQGNDTLDGGAGDDFLFGDRDNEAGSALLTGDDIVNGGAGADWMEGNKGHDILNGGDQNDVVLGGEGNDTLNGQNGNDFLYGDTGMDILNGGAGADDLYGGADADTFLWDMEALGFVDDLYDFVQGVGGDLLDISALIAPLYDPVQDAITDFVQITDNGTDSILAVDTNGTAGGAVFTDIAILHNVTGLTDEEALETAGMLVTV